MHTALKTLLPVVFWMFTLAAQGQSLTVQGTVRDTAGVALTGANAVFEGTSLGAITDAAGRFGFSVPEGQLDFPATLVVTYVGYSSFRREFGSAAEAGIPLEITLEASLEIGEVEVVGSDGRQAVSTITLDPKILEFAPTVSGSVESLIMLGPGVSSRSELSNQYSVRGGNYDENLVYVNDFEVYRPFLMRNGQQEGLSFINPDLVQGISFSSGGFAAQYGDKMSSVLDIRYKRPSEFAGSVTGSLRGAAVHVEGASKSQRFRYLAGVRYQNTAAILKSLDTKGEYNPNAYDVQTDLLFTLTDRLELEVLFNHSATRFGLVPSEQQTTTGAVNQAIRFSVFFDGNEDDAFRNTMAGLSLRHHTDRTDVKFMASAFRMKESERFNIIGQYRLDEVETDFSSDDFGDVKNTLGIGTFQDWGRNELEAAVLNLGTRGSYGYRQHLLQWGLSFQYEWIEDQLSEWERIDSAGYSLPYTGNQVSMFGFLRSEASLANWRTQAYLQHVWNFLTSADMRVSLNAGARLHYWNYNRQAVVSPRAQLMLEPETGRQNTWLSIKLAAGMYEQPPFYREIRDREGVLRQDVKAQRSVHVVLGTEFGFNTWNDRNFKLTTEAYYKHLSRLNPYELDDIRIRYYGDNLASGYAYGVDVRLFGELVKGTDSWMSLSFLKVQEDLSGDSYDQVLNADGEVITPYTENNTPADTVTVFPGHIPRPTEQVFNFGLYFSDYMTKNKNFKMHLAFNFGTGLPYGPPDGNRYTDNLRAPGYKRVDIGFSALLLDGDKERKSRRDGNFGSHFDKIWVSAEVFNLLGSRNTVSYRWIKDTQNIRWPLPNYLTSRRFNVKIHIKFS